MTQAGREVKLGLVMFPTGAHIAAWRDPRSEADGHVKLSHFAEAARIAERGLLDFLFVADSSAVRGSEDVRSVMRQPHVTGFEPVTLLSALAALTRHIGLAATSSTSLHQPYQVARQFASLDLLSGGRAAVNVVTSTQDLEARNFSLDSMYGHAQRYERAEEFIEVVLGLWDGWDRDAFVRDRTSGVFFDPERVHVLNHRGKHFSVRGPLNVPRSPQDRPLIVQSGSSDPGKELAAKAAEIVFTAQTTLAGAQAFYADVKRRVASYGRDPANVLVMPGLHPIVGETREEAQRKADVLADLIHIDIAVAQLSVVMGGFDLSRYPLDCELPYGEIPETNGPKSRQQMLIERARSENLTIRQLARIAAESYGHGMIIGTVGQVADRMEEWFHERGADGFILNATLLPASLEDIAIRVVPELQRRGLFRRGYEGATLRENLGLPLPRSRY